MFNFNVSTANLTALKSFATEHNIAPTGDRRLLATWRDAVTAFIAERSISMEELQGA